MSVSLIVAMSENQMIGRDGDLPWHLGRDLKRFKSLTMGHSIVMGRKTYESIGRPLPGRTNVVITSDREYKTEGVVVAHSLDHALELVSTDEEAFIVGGATVYRQSLPFIRRLYVTLVHADIDGDVRFPHLDWQEWILHEELTFAADEKNDYRHSFRIYDRAG